jgi:2,3-bisphosphoglycerate-independent phosphoglycerate mutase
MVHVNAADEEAHQRNHAGKVDAIQKIDRLVLGPVLDELQDRYRDQFRIVVCGDHKTRCSDGKHLGDPVPYALYGAGVEASGVDVFGESRCEAHAPVDSLAFLESIGSRA